MKNQPVLAVYEDRGIVGRGRVVIRDDQGRVLASDSALLRLSPADQTKDSVHLHIAANPASFRPEDLDKGKHYRGILDLAIDEQGKLTGVNTVWLEHYLYGVVAAEMGDYGGLESLKAQAVVARSQAVGRIDQGMVARTALYDFDDTKMIQVYNGKGTENSLARQAVDATRGETLICDGRPIEAPYSQSCGGVVAGAEDIWDGEPRKHFARKADRAPGGAPPNLSDSAAAAQWIIGNADCFCNPRRADFPKYMADGFHWSKTFTADQLTRMFDKSHQTGRIRDVVIDRRTPSGRVRGIRIVGARRTARIEKELAIRGAFNDLKSTFFILEPKYDRSKNLTSLTIRGAGHGHGVGMCQMGAISMAGQGYGYRQILGHYYSGVRIRKLY